MEICDALFYGPVSESIWSSTLQKSRIGWTWPSPNSDQAQAHLISTFIQKEASKRFRNSLFHSLLYIFHIEGDTSLPVSVSVSLPDPGYPPYYDQSFSDVIKFVKDKTHLNPVSISVKEWYLLLLEKNVTRREVDQEGRTELIPCRVEEKYPEVFWSD